MIFRINFKRKFSASTPRRTITNYIRLSSVHDQISCLSNIAFSCKDQQCFFISIRCKFVSRSNYARGRYAAMMTVIFKTIQNFMVSSSIENNAQVTTAGRQHACVVIGFSYRLAFLAVAPRRLLSQLTPLTHEIKRSRTCRIFIFHVNYFFS